MSMWTCLKRWLAQTTCDKTELNRKIIRVKKCFDEASWPCPSGKCIDACDKPGSLKLCERGRKTGG